MLTNIDQDLVNILTDSEQTYRPMGASRTQLTYKKFMIKCIFCLSSTLIYLYGQLKFKCFIKKYIKVTNICNPLNVMVLFGGQN